LALIDNEGCTKVRQTLQGSFHDPQVEQPSVLRSLASPVEKILQMGRDLFPGGECELFYSGSVAPPK
ncbi:MAG: AsmA family protein, partial [Deltaproteobacteria bacterium]|nr:AsmA family protein [Deltaproteobacteria bacterium]